MAQNDGAPVPKAPKQAPVVRNAPPGTKYGSNPNTKPKGG